MRKLLNNKRGQLDNPVMIVAIMIIGLLFLAPVMLKIMTTMKTSVGNSLGNISNGGDVAQTNFNAVMNTAVNTWDKVIMVAFFLLVVLLLVSAFLVDAHPIFIILFILSNMFLILFAPNIIDAVDKVYDSPTFAGEIAKLTFMDTIRTYYGEFLVGLMILSGIIIFGKLALFRSKQK